MTPTGDSNRAKYSLVWYLGTKRIPVNHMKTHLPVFGAANLPAKLGAQALLSIYRKNERVFTQGDSASEVFYIRDGAVKLSVMSADGKEAVISLLGQDNFFGEARLLTDHPRRLVSATTMIRSTVLRFDSQTMNSFLRDDPVFRDAFVNYLVARSQRVEEDLADQILHSIEKRLARALLRLARAEDDGSGGAARVPVTVTHELLAQMIGATRPRVSYFIKKFKKQGLLDDRKGLRVNRSEMAALIND